MDLERILFGFGKKLLFLHGNLRVPPPMALSKGTMVGK